MKATQGARHVAIRALITTNSLLHEQLTDLISPGFMRGRLSLLDLP